MFGQRASVVFLCGLLGAFSACATEQDAPAAPSGAPATIAAPTSTIDSLAGSWKSVTSATPVGPCSVISYTVTPTGASSASVAYQATCGSTGISGSGLGTAAGNMMNWTTDGSILAVGPAPCAFRLGGTATPAPDSAVTLTYSGTVCGVPVSGSDTLRR